MKEPMKEQMSVVSHTTTGEHRRRDAVESRCRRSGGVTGGADAALGP